MIPFLIKKSNSTLIALLLCFSLNGQNIKTVLVLDPGHGGKDTGAVGWDNLLEKDIVLNICNEVVKLNEQLYNEKIEIYMTRENDRFISLSNRAKLARAIKADIFIAVHCNNMNGNHLSKGMEVFVISPLPKYSVQNIKKSISLASDLNQSFTKKLKIKDRGIKFQNFQVLRETIDYCPSVLLETAFISNSKEAEYFKDKKNITAVALAIIESVNKYITDGI